jgi:site-specific recombinase XerD
LSGETLAHVKSCAKGKLPTDPLFSRADGRRWDRFAWRDAINDSVAAAKLPEAVCAYTLRHSAITDLVVSGLDLFHVAQLAGTSVAVIEKNYGHLRRQQVRKGLQVLGLK